MKGDTHMSNEIIRQFDNTEFGALRVVKDDQGELVIARPQTLLAELMMTRRVRIQCAPVAASRWSQ